MGRHKAAPDPESFEPIVLKQKMTGRIDFTGVIVVDGANPNGDPLDGNSPRKTWEGKGYISDVALKRKIRNRLLADGYEVFVQKADEPTTDGFISLKSRIERTPETATLFKSKNSQALVMAACEKWIDVRAFGQIFSVLNETGVSANARGPVAITEAISLDVITPREVNITRSVNLESDSRLKDSSTFGNQWRVDKAAYVFRGSIFPMAALKTGFSDADAEAIKQAILYMFDGDTSASRPVGTMTLHKLWWWHHNSLIGLYPPAKVFRSLEFSPAKEYPYYTVKETPLKHLEPEVTEGW